jgi:hypothetical protein
MMIRLTLCAIGLVLLVNLACSTQPPPNSGIEGQVTIGPVSPVSQPGVVNSRPFVADLLFRRAADGEIVAEAKSGDDGAFRIALEPGEYVVEPTQGNPLPTAPSQEVTVVAGRFTRIHVDYDSGIR